MQEATTPLADRHGRARCRSVRTLYGKRGTYLSEVTYFGQDCDHTPPTGCFIWDLIQNPPFGRHRMNVPTRFFTSRPVYLLLEYSYFGQDRHIHLHVWRKIHTCIHTRIHTHPHLGGSGFPNPFLFTFFGNHLFTLSYAQSESLRYTHQDFFKANGLDRESHCQIDSSYGRRKPASFLYTDLLLAYLEYKASEKVTFSSDG